jgi:2-phosphoxylose phosphatase
MFLAVPRSGNGLLTVHLSGFKRDMIDSLEPTYPCSAAQKLFSGSQANSQWTAHLERTQELFAALDAVSDVPSDASDWHVSYDHYFDNLSSRLCHEKPLPCNISNPELCVTQAQADQVFRLGEFEYSYLYRDAPTSLAASTASFGVWVAELAQHIRDQIADADGKIIYRHNVAHDGSLSRLLSILQIDVMVWPGMGSEVVFELYRKRDNSSPENGQFFVRVLWGGQVMRSSNPYLGILDMLPVDVLLAYIDALVGQKAQQVPTLCNS